MWSFQQKYIYLYDIKYMFTFKEKSEILVNYIEKIQQYSVENVFFTQFTCEKK